jgi:hypothetical protein
MQLIAVENALLDYCREIAHSFFAWRKSEGVGMNA